MNDIAGAVLGGQCADTAGKLALQCAESLRAAFGQDADQVDDSVGRRDHRLEIIIVQRVAGNQRHLPDDAHGLKVFRPFGIAAQHDDARALSGEFLDNGAPDKAGPANDCNRLFHPIPPAPGASCYARIRASR